MNGEVEVMKLLTSAFLDTPIPSLSSNSATVTFLQGDLSWLVAVVATLSLIMAAGRLVWLRKAEPARDALAGIFRLVVVTGAGVVGISLLSAAGDSFSTWIIGQSTNNPAGSIATIGTITTTAFSSDFLVLVVGTLGIIGCLVQIALLLVRSALLIVLAGIWPLSAAASMTPAGSQWFKKTTAWLLAFVLYKPAAAIIYATAFRLMGSSSNGLGSIEGIVLLLMASLALPALMRFVVPMVSAAGGVGTAAVVGAAAGLAVGAAMIVGTGGAAAAAGAAGDSGAAGLIPKGGGDSGSPTGAASRAKPSPSGEREPASPSPTAAPPTAGRSARGGGQALAAGRAVHQAVSSLGDTVEKVTDGAPAPS